MRHRRPWWAWLAVALTLTACTRAARPTESLLPAAPVKLVVEAEGLYEVSAQDLAAVGFVLQPGDSTGVVLSTGGQVVPIEEHILRRGLLGRSGGPTLRFYGQGLPTTAHTGRNVYWLARSSEAAGEGPGQVRESSRVVATRSAAPPAGVTLARVVSATVRAEEQRQYLPKVGPDGDPWLWQSIFAPAELKTPLVTPHAVEGAAELRMRIWGNSSAAVEPDHHLILELNGTRVADASWDGQGPHLITGTVPSGVLRDGDNELVLRAPGDTGADADVVLLDWVEVTYVRELVLDDGALTFSGQADGYSVRLAGKGEVVAVWDITDPMRPVALRDYRVTGGELSFGSDRSERRFIVATASGMRRPLAVTRKTSPDLRDWPGGADLIIVTVPQFRDALAPLIAARQAAGLRVAVVDVEAVYDTFSAGRVDPRAIRDFVQHAVAAWPRPAPRFLLLAGDASYDPRGYLQGTEADLIPTMLVDTHYTGLTASDVWYALPAADGGRPGSGPAGRPLLAVGRFPAQNADQIATMVAKTLAYERDTEAATWRSRALLLADNDEPGFASAAADFAQRLTPYQAEQVTVVGDGAAARTALLTGLREGVGLVGYFGHGGVTLWAQERILGVDDVPKLTNRDRLPLVFTVTCLSGLFQHPSTPSLGEVLLRAREGGAVAALVPSSAAVLPDQSWLSRSLADALSDPQAQTLGEVVLRAQGGLPDLAGGVREILLTFNLLGDPSLRFPRANGS